MILEIKNKGQIKQAIYDDEDYNIVSCHTWHIDHGYARTTLREHEKRSSISMHRLILQSKSAHTHHINENRLDNRKSNLKPVSEKEHAKEHPERGGGGQFQNGRLNIRSKLTQDQVLEIRRLHKEGISGRKIAKMFDMGSTPIAYILNRKTWNHI